LTGGVAFVKRNPQCTQRPTETLVAAPHCGQTKDPEVALTRSILASGRSSMHPKPAGAGVLTEA